jgi:hypothetical protein
MTKERAGQSLLSFVVVSELLEIHSSLGTLHAEAVCSPQICRGEQLVDAFVHVWGYLHRHQCLAGNTAKSLDSYFQHTCFCWLFGYCG